MSDDEKAKAEKMAAAKKRYEQLKKQKAKKGGKKKEEKTEAPAEAEASTEPTTAEEKPEEKSEEKPEQVAPEPIEATSVPPPPADEEEEDEEPAELGMSKQSHGRKPSVAIESRQRSESFYRSGAATGPLSPGVGVSSEVYREQAQKIEELEKENKRLASEVEESEKRWKKGEEELEELRESRGDVAIAVEKGKEADKLRTEVESLRRQLSQAQAQSQSNKSTRRTSTASPSQSASIDDLNAQVASKSATIESLELEISNLNRQLSEQTNKNNELQSKITSLESAVQKAEQEASSTKTELQELKASLDKAGDQAEKDGSDRDSAQTRIAQLEAELGTANRKASDSISRAELLEKKIETLTQLHRDNDARNQARVQEHKKIEREATELRTRITGLSNENARLREAEQRRRKADLGSIEDSSVQELLDEERDRLLAKVRELEEENFELRRGVWRDRRRDMQPSIDDHADPNNFDDIDLSGAPSRQPPPNRTHSSFQDVIQSGISAFTGQTPAHRRSDAANKPKPRQESLGSLDEFEIDEDAFRRAQEDEAKNRLERVKEVKRGLVQFKGWRPDFVDVRVGMGGVFEV